MPRRPSIDPRELSLACAKALYDRKGQDIKILDVQTALAIADYFLIVTGRNRRHLRAMADELRNLARERGLALPREEGGSGDAGGWILLDMGDIVIHLFEAETRAFYDLDALWADAPVVAWSA